MRKRGIIDIGAFGRRREPRNGRSVIASDSGRYDISDKPNAYTKPKIYASHPKTVFQRKDGYITIHLAEDLDTKHQLSFFQKRCNQINTMIKNGFSTTKDYMANDDEKKKINNLFVFSFEDFYRGDLHKIRAFIEELIGTFEIEIEFEEEHKELFSD